ncbi:hypothetical protein [Mycobacterium hubeiense]|uniref:hypothetical protein n=1 Tax=Mycobacterium hubeiense TaxID=1867256 RepID=UPI000C7F66EB|nr:hypothetical protein [Mycobacterium sp. QGD 101]
MRWFGSALLALAVWCAPVAAAETTVAPPERPPGDPGVVFVDNPAIVDPRPVPVDSWSRVPNPNAVAVHFTTGTPECYGVHATVQETPDTVTVRLQSGTPPEAVGRMCIMIALDGTLEVPLASPLGDRRVLSVY